MILGKANQRKLACSIGMRDDVFSFNWLVQVLMQIIFELPNDFGVLDVGKAIFHWLYVYFDFICWLGLVWWQIVQSVSGWI